MELPNQDKIKILGDKTYKYLNILETDTIKQVEIKKIKIDSYSRRNYLAETLIKE